MHEITIQRFWSKVDKSAGPDGCWLWTAGTYKGGYGQFWCDGVGRRAQAIALELHTGEAAAGRCALHNCDNPPCCNPTHLWWGTNEENTADRQRKGRTNMPKWNDLAWTKLTPEIVQACRARYTPYSKVDGSAALAREFGVSQSVMSAAIRGRHWGHVQFGRCGA